MNSLLHTWSSSIKQWNTQIYTLRDLGKLSPRFHSSECDSSFHTCSWSSQGENELDLSWHARRKWCLLAGEDDVLAGNACHGYSASELCWNGVEKLPRARRWVRNEKWMPLYSFCFPFYIQSSNPSPQFVNSVASIARSSGSTFFGLEFASSSSP